MGSEPRARGKAGFRIGDVMKMSAQNMAMKKSSEEGSNRTAVAAATARQVSLLALP